MFILPVKTAHFYDMETGKPCHEVPRADGKGMKPTTIREARIKNLACSVTSILKVINKETLTDWRISQALLSCLTLPRKQGESDTDFAQRVVHDMDEQSRAASEFGTKLHKAAEMLHLGIPYTGDPKVEAHIKGYREWFNNNVATVIHAEKVLVNKLEGYAGTLDLACILKDGRKVVADIKTQGIKFKVAYYDEWPMQLAAYEQCLEDDFGLMSIVIDSINPNPPHIKEWEPSPKYWQAFQAANQLFRYLKNYYPNSN